MTGVFRMIDAMKRRSLLAASIPLPLLHASDDAKKGQDIIITLHDSHGASSDSKWGELPVVYTHAAGTNIYLKITNVSKKSVTLWQPGCPPGDHVTFEFRDVGDPSKVQRAVCTMDYTGGMGNPKTFVLAAGSDLIVDINLIRYWSFPLQLAAGEERTVEMRALYESQPLPKDEPFQPASHAQVWAGTAATPWEKLWICNRTTKAILPRVKGR